MPTAPDPLRAPAMAEESVGALVHRAIGDARAYAEAEISLLKARAGERLGVWKAAAVLFGIAGVLALAALVALLVGLILTLATLVGPGGATAIVVGVTLAVAAVLGWLGAKRLGQKAP